MSFDPLNTDTNEVHQLDDLNDRLYRRDLAGRKPRRFDALHPRNFPVPKDWSNTAQSAKAGAASLVSHPTFFRKFFYFALGFAALAVLIVGFIFLTGGNTVSNDNIDINVLGNSFTAGGEELPLQIEVVNRNSSDLELADLIVEYDKGGDASSGATRVRTLESFGTIRGGKSASKSISATLFGEQGTVKNINITFQYHLHGSNAIFVKQASFPVTISSAPVSLTVESPQNLTPNQQITLTVTTKSNSAATLSQMLLSVAYPPGFKFIKSVPEADSFDHVWKLGDLAPGAERSVAITGTLYGTDGDAQAFRVYTGAAKADDPTKIGLTYNSLLQSITLVKPFITANLTINGSGADQTPVSSAGVIDGGVAYANNLSTEVRNAQVTVSLSGNALDPASVLAPNGFYDSSKGTITWDATTVPDLANLAPGDSGMLSFSFKAKPLVSSGTTLSSPSVRLRVSIKGAQSLDSGSLSEVTDFQERTAIVSSDFGFSNAVSHAGGPIANTGPIPPKAGEPTTYTVTWGITNSANMLANGTVSTTLPTYVEWVGTISPSGAPVLYDGSSRVVTWNVGQVPAGTGVSGPSKSVSFQVRITPSTSQVGLVPALTLSTKASAQDTFTNQILTVSRAGLSTAISSEGSSGVVSN